MKSITTLPKIPYDKFEDFETKDATKTNTLGFSDSYSPYNKPLSVIEWLDAHPNIHNATLAVTDNDMTFVDQIPSYVPPGKPIAFERTMILWET
eukprot:UN03222